MPWLLLLSLVLAACGAAPTPGASQATGQTTAAQPVAQANTPAPTATRQPATSTPTATERPTRAPTATWVPLPSPAPTATDSGVTHLGIGDAWTMVAVDKAVLVDVRPVANYEEDHVPDAISMPVDEVAERYKELPDDRLLIFYCNCKNEAESTEAALAAQAHGLEQVAVLQGGLEAWLRAGY
ncbi:MAG: rhodanese-like domain-containing protein, partial [Anaerolineae bacterium]